MLLPALIDVDFDKAVEVGVIEEEEEEEGVEEEDLSVLSVPGGRNDILLPNI